MLRLTTVVLLLGLALPAHGETPPNPECGSIRAMGSGLAIALYRFARIGYAVATSLVPEGGLRVDDEGQAYLTASWPLEIPFGPASGSERIDFGTCAAPLVERYPISRIVLEPIISKTHRDGVDIGFETRAGYRFMWHASESSWGVGVGMGSTLDWQNDTRASASPELRLQYGECCTPSYLTITFRYDRYLAGDGRSVIGGLAGWTFW